ERFIETHMKLIDFKHSSNKKLFILPSHCKKMDDFEEVLKLLDALNYIYDNISDYMEILEAIMDKAKRYFYISVVLMIISLFLSAQNPLIESWFGSLVSLVLISSILNGILLL